MNKWEWQLLEDKRQVESIEIGGIHAHAGDRVRLRPRSGGDIMDLALSGQLATIEAIEQDYEGKLHISVVLDEDPGRDLGMLRQTGHRFFFTPEEVETISETTPRPRPVKPSILIAGIGNIFLGDDAFGIEVVRRLNQSDLSGKVRVADFGIRGLDLTYALQDGYETVILVDAIQRGNAPGTTCIIEPDLNDESADQPHNPVIDGHGMDPVRVLRLAASMGSHPKRVLVIGCEPQFLGGEEGSMGLSAPVETAVDETVRRIESLIPQLLSGQWPGSQQ